MSRLQITYSPADPYEGWIDLKLIGEFSGSGGFSGEPVAFAAFAQALSAYPIGEDNPARFAEQEVVIELAPVDAVGHLRLTFELGYPILWGPYLRISFPTEYSRVGALQEALLTFIRDPGPGVEIEIP
jgi:hypothetical protein